MRTNVIASVFLAAVILLTSGTAISADEQKFELKPSAGMHEVLAENVGKRVALRLDSGDEIEGTVTQVGKSLVHVSRLSGKEFYDSVISIDRVSAVRMRVREK